MSVKAELVSLDGGQVISSAEFEDPQDALKWLWDEAEAVDEFNGPVGGRIDGKPVAL